jgi:hypothetical protein
MNGFSQQWLVRRASPPGTLACGLRGPDGKSICHSLEDLCTPDRMERILAQMASVQTALFPEDFAPRWTTWAFEQGQIRLVKRPDHWLLGLVVRMESDAALKLDSLSEEFLALDI